MYTINNDTVVAVIESYCRMWRMWIESDEEIILGNGIQSAGSTQQSTSLSDDIELGAVCSAQWTASLNAAANRNRLGTEFRVYLYLCDAEHFGSGTTWGDLGAYTWEELSQLTVEQVGELGNILEDVKIPMATLTCVKSQKSGAATDLTLADKLYFSDRLYVPTVTFPATGKGVEDDICEQLGIENGNDYTSTPFLFDSDKKRLFDAASPNRRLKGAPFDFTITKTMIPKDATMRQVLGYIASAHGQLGYIDRFGRYVRKWYGRSAKTLDNNTVDVPTLSEQQNVITGMICTVGEDKELRCGDTTGRVLEFENPFMTEVLFLSLWQRVRDYSWYTTDMYHRLGDPRFDVGDVITYKPDEDTEYDIPITSLDFAFDGGLAANISAVGLNVEEQIEPV